MWSKQKMKYVAFIHNDDVECFHVIIQGTHKLVVMGRINFEHHVLIKRWQVGEKMNVMGGTFKEEKKQGNHRKQFAYVAKCCACFQSSRIHSSMSVENAIEKLHKITRENEAQRIKHK
jgi:urease alpha subunit